MTRPGSARRARLERMLLVAWACLLLGIAAVLAVRPWRDDLLVHLQSTSDRWERRWERRLDADEALVAAGRFEEAAERLEALDRDFPAPEVKYARDTERERLLAALGASYEALGRKGRALDTYRRLVAFDPRNYASHEKLALAALHFRDNDAALDAFKAVLRIDPAHLPSVKHVMDMSASAANWDQAISVFEGYLDAFVLERLELSAGETRASVRVPVDGLPHEVSVRLDPAPTGGELRIAHGDWPTQVSELALEGSLAVGEPGPPPTAVVPVDGDRAVLPPAPRGWPRVRLHLRLFKPVDATLWSDAETAYRYRLDWDGLARARARLAPPPPAGHGGGPS